MKYLFIIGTVIALLNSVPVDAEVNEPVEEIKSTEIKQADSQNAQDVVAQEDIRVISEKTSGTRDTVIIAFTFLLGALTVMATLFGVFIGYMGYKSGKEYEKEVARAEDAAKLAQDSAKKVEAVLRDIQQRGEETIIGMQSSFKDTIENMKVRFEPEEGEPTGADKKLKEFFVKLFAKDEADDHKGVADTVEGAIAFDEENSELWYIWARALALQKKHQDALIKINTTIQKDSKHGRAYFFRGMLRLVWARREQRQPHMSEIIKDLKKSIELGYEVRKDQKESLSNYLTDVEYKDVFDRTKEEDGFGKE